MKVQNSFNEMVISEFIGRYPSTFLQRDLTLATQQREINGFRPDLIFEDQSHRKVIVEIQRRHLDRSRLYRAIEYRDFLMFEDRESDPTVILVAHEMPDKHVKLCRSHNIEVMIIERDEFASIVAGLV